MNVKAVDNHQLVSAGVAASNKESNRSNKIIDKFKSKTSLIVTASALGAAAVTGIYLVMRGKAKQALRFANFSGAQALTKSGEKYTGEIVKECPDGSKFIMRYEDGFLQSSTKFKGENKISAKIYKYREDGKLLEVTQNIENPGRLGEAKRIAFSKSINSRGFEVTKNLDNTFAINKNTNEYIIWSRNKTKYVKNGKVKYEKIRVDDAETLKVYNNDGTLAATFISKGGHFKNAIDAEGNIFQSNRTMQKPDGSRLIWTPSIIYNTSVRGGLENLKIKTPRRYLEVCDNDNIQYAAKGFGDDNIAFAVRDLFKYKKNNLDGSSFLAQAYIVKDFKIDGGQKRYVPFVLTAKINGGKMFNEDVNFLDNGLVKIVIGDKNVIYNPKTKKYDTNEIPASKCRELFEKCQTLIDEMKKDFKRRMKFLKVDYETFDLERYIRKCLSQK